MSPALIEVHDVCFDYPGHRALNNINLSIGKAAISALVGPNGAGKTTLLRCIAALDTPVSGQILVGGIDVHADPRGAHQLMGYLSDSFGLYGDLSVERCLIYAARAQGVLPEKVGAAVTRVLEFLNLADKRRQLTSTLSRGQRQRVAIAQAIVHRPQVLLLDEPASGLDPEARSSLAGVFRYLQAEGMTLLVSSHILAELDEYSTHMLAMDKGRILEYRALSSDWLSAPTEHSQSHPQAHSQAHPLRHLLVEFASAEEASAAQAWFAEQVLAPHSPLTLKPSTGNSDNTRVHFSFAGSLSEQADLLAACIDAAHRPILLMPDSENLQQSYLKTLQFEREKRLNYEP